MTETQDLPERTSGIAAQLAQYSSVIAPTSLITAFLFYFGYLATRARFEYFGVYLDLVNLSTADLLLYGSEVVYVPIVLGGLTMLVVVALKLVGQWLVSDPGRDTLSTWAAICVALIAVLALLRAIVGIVVPPVSATEPAGLTPLCLTSSVLLLRYSATLWQTVADRRSESAWTPAPTALTAARYAVIVIAVSGLFWAAGSFASLYGTGLAQDDAARLPTSPEIILDTAEELVAPPSNVAHLALSSKGKFRHRYSGLRLLVESDHHLYLVPAQWDPDSSRTLVIDNSADIRLELVPGTSR